MENSSNSSSYSYNHSFHLNTADFRYLMQIHTATAIMCIVYSVCIILANGLIMTTILSSAVLRTQLRYQLIVNICFVDLLQGVIFYPLYGHHVLKNFHPSCEMGIMLYFGFVHTDVFLEMWLLVIQNVFYFTRQLSVAFPVLSRRASAIFKAFLNALPWMIALIVLPVLIIVGFDKSSNCIVYTQNSTRLHASVISYFLPAVIILILLFCFIVVHKCAKPAVRVAEQSLLDVGSGLEHPACYIVPSLVAVFFPTMRESYHAYRMAISFSYYLSNVKLMGELNVSGTLLDLLRCGILPLTWLILPDVRAAITDLWRSLRRVRSRWTEFDTVTYQKEEQAQ